jgi:nucleoside-diphosphate-sugar epimerase
MPIFPTIRRPLKHATKAPPWLTRTTRFPRLDLRFAPLNALLTDVEVLFHLAAMPGLMQSWTNFDGYWTCNVKATQQLLEAVVCSAGRLRQIVYASTSSVYGSYASGDELMPTRPVSPYGVTYAGLMPRRMICRL